MAFVVSVYSQPVRQTDQHRRHGPMNRTTAQIACEAIINYPDAGWTLDDAEVVLADARALDVAPLYVDMLAELVGLWRALDVSSFPHKAAGRTERGKA